MAKITKKEIFITGSSLIVALLLVVVALAWQKENNLTLLPPEIITAAAGVTRRPTISNMTATNITSSGATLSAYISVDRDSPSTEVNFSYVATGGSFQSAYATTINSPQTVSYSLAGLSQSTNYTFQSTATNSAGSTLSETTFQTLVGTQAPQKPIVSNVQAAAYDSGATLNFAVNPNNAETTITLRYGSNTSYSDSTSAIPKISTETIISKEITGLNSGITYYYLVGASNSAGISEVSGNFTTTSPTPTSELPTLTTSTATGITKNETILHGSFLSGGLPTITWFEYGPTPALGSATFYQSHGGTPSGNIEEKISNLKSNIAYYFRAAGLNAAGTDYGDIMSFTTLSTGVSPTSDLSDQAILLLECPTLKRGKSSGTYFSCNWILQTLLKALDYDIDIDGIYGKGTRAIVREFQDDYGLSVDGKTGPKTKQKLFLLFTEASGDCALMRNITTGAVNCFGCSGGLCSDPAPGFSVWNEPFQTGYVGIPYRCVAGVQGCVLAQ